MRTQTACNLTVRLTWSVSQGNSRYETFGCVQDEDMAVTMAHHAARSAPPDHRLIGAETSPSAGRNHPWKRLAYPEV